jgi:hypothetical protein
LTECRVAAAETGTTEMAAGAEREEEGVRIAARGSIEIVAGEAVAGVV